VEHAEHDVRDDERAAEHDIANVLVRYATGIDRRDWELFRTCFTVDVVAEYDGIGTWHGVEEITEFMRTVHAGMGHTMHRVGNLAISVDGDRATARSYVDALLMAADGNSGVNAVGFYDDELVRAVDGWRIARRHFTTVRTRVV
jgi:3-phenylpropionate/cinnamic acid dioxygenase small subunit